MFKRNKKSSQTDEVEEEQYNNEMPPAPPQQYTDEPRGSYEQHQMEKLPQNSEQPDTIAFTNSNPMDNIELAQFAGNSQEVMNSKLAAQKAKSYFLFASSLTALGFLFSIVSAFSCSFGIVNWAADGNSAAYQSSISHIGLFRWYNPVTSTCWAYSADDTEFFFVDGAARGLAAAAVVLGGCAALVDVVVMLANLGSCATKESCSKFSLESTSNAKTFFGLSGLTVLSSILQISTMSYFSQGNQTEYAITCNASLDSNCSMGVGAHYAIIAFIMYLLAGGVYAMAGVGCKAAEAAKSGGSDGEVEDTLPPPPPPPLPPTQQQQQQMQKQGQYEEEDLGSLDTDSAGSGTPPPAPSAKFAQNDLESV